MFDDDASSLARLCDTGLSLDSQRVALIQGKRSMTYAELEQRINRVANGLISLGVERFERVLVIFENDIRFPEVLLGIVRAGAVAVPVNFKFSRRSTSSWLETVGVASSSAAPGRPNPSSPVWPTLPRSVSSSMPTGVRFEAMRTGWPHLRPNAAIMGRPAATSASRRTPRARPDGPRGSSRAPWATA